MHRAFWQSIKKNIFKIYYSNIFLKYWPLNRVNKSQTVKNNGFVLFKFFFHIMITVALLSLANVILLKKKHVTFISMTHICRSIHFF